MITATDAKRVYGLSESQLERLPVSLSRSRYHSRIRKYDIMDVREAALAKHGVDDPAEISRRRRVNLNINVTDTMYPQDFLDLWNTHKSGTYGIKAAYKRYQEFHRQFVPPSISVFDVIVPYVIKNNTCIIRETELRAALAERGLAIRGDSSLCSMYIRGTCTHTLYEVVSIMENMAFLHKYTNYSSIIKKHYNKMRSQSNTNNNGWMSRHAVSMIAQSSAMRAYKGDRDIIPEGLRNLHPPVTA